MIILTLIIFYTALFSICWTYLIYPFTMITFTKNKVFIMNDTHSTPTVEVIFAAYNEASVIEEKIRSIYFGNYPHERIKVTIGSDNSTDGTDEIIENLCKEFPSLSLKKFTTRTGKTGIINALTAEGTGTYFLLTDANIIFTQNTIPALIQRMQIEKAGIVGGHILYQQTELDKGISFQENTYLNLENKLKAAESTKYGMAMGVEGGCYLIKRHLFPIIPATFYMEDFFVSMHALTNGAKVVFESKAVVYEDISTQISEEYKRKVRISIGNFQNLGFYKSVLFKKFRPLGFLFLSHKILRWLTPFSLIVLALSAFFLSFHFSLFKGFLLAYLLFLLLAWLGIVFSQRKGLTILKFPGHFLYMNLALLHGFIKYLKGIDSNVWQPTKRNQD